MACCTPLQAKQQAAGQEPDWQAQKGGGSTLTFDTQDPVQALQASRAMMASQLQPLMRQLTGAVATRSPAGQSVCDPTAVRCKPFARGRPLCCRPLAALASASAGIVLLAHAYVIKGHPHPASITLRSVYRVGLNLQQEINKHPGGLPSPKLQEVSHALTCGCVCKHIHPAQDKLRCVKQGPCRQLGRAWFGLGVGPVCHSSMQGCW